VGPKCKPSHRNDLGRKIKNNLSFPPIEPSCPVHSVLEVTSYDLGDSNKQPGAGERVMNKYKKRQQNYN